MYWTRRTFSSRLNDYGTEPGGNWICWGRLRLVVLLPVLLGLIGVAGHSGSYSTSTSGPFSPSPEDHTLNSLLPYKNPPVPSYRLKFSSKPNKTEPGNQTHHQNHNYHSKPPKHPDFVLDSFTRGRSQSDEDPNDSDSSDSDSKLIPVVPIQLPPPNETIHYHYTDDLDSLKFKTDFSKIILPFKTTKHDLTNPSNYKEFSGEFGDFGNFPNFDNFDTDFVDFQEDDYHYQNPRLKNINSLNLEKSRRNKDKEEDQQGAYTMERGYLNYPNYHYDYDYRDNRSSRIGEFNINNININKVSHPHPHFSYDEYKGLKSLKSVRNFRPQDYYDERPFANGELRKNRDIYKNPNNPMHKDLEKSGHDAEQIGHDKRDNLKEKSLKSVVRKRSKNNKDLKSRSKSDIVSNSNPSPSKKVKSKRNELKDLKIEGKMTKLKMRKSDTSDTDTKQGDDYESIDKVEKFESKKIGGSKGPGLKGPKSKDSADFSRESVSSLNLPIGNNSIPGTSLEDVSLSLSYENGDESDEDEKLMRRRPRRSVVHLYDMVVCATGCNPLAYKGYGCYCGFLGSGLTVDGIDRCCAKHDWCYHHAKCPPLLTYFVPYYWTCNDGRPRCVTEYRGWKGICGANLCECDRQFAECLRKFPCPRGRAMCMTSPWRNLPIGPNFVFLA